MATQRTSAFSVPLLVLHIACAEQGTGNVTSIVQPVPSAPSYPTAVNFAPPLENYAPDSCLGWGQLNTSYQACEKPGIHVGDDFCAPPGTVVRSIGAGVVTFARAWKKCPNWAQLTMMEHRLADGQVVSSIYGHCEPLVGEGTVVEGPGVPICKIISANCFASHLHFAIYRGPSDEAEQYEVGAYPRWAAGYLCQERFPGSYEDPGSFLAGHSTQERCNFLDDDSDGQLDEGNDWKLGNPRTLYTGRFVRHFASTTLADGRMAVAGYDDTDFYVLILTPSGAVDAGPFLGSLEQPNVNDIDLVEGHPGELVVVAGTNNYACAELGCAIRAMRIDTATNTPSEPLTIPTSYSPLYGARVTFSAGAFVVGGGARSPLESRLTWFDGSLTTHSRDEVAGAISSLNLATTTAGVAWCQGLMGTIGCGLYSADGTARLGPLRAIPEEGASLSHNGTSIEDGLVALGSDLVLSYTLPTRQARLVRLSSDGSVVADPADVDAPGFFSSGLASFRTT